MGKLGNDDDDDGFSHSLTIAAEAASIVDESNRIRLEREGYFCNNFTRFINIKCIIALLFGICVFISALFLLPPFFKFSDPADFDLDPRYRGHAIVARFKLEKTVSFVKDNALQLEADIYNELASANAANAKVKILSLEGSGLNSTDVVFGIDSSSKHSEISMTGLSLIRSSFASFLTQYTNFTLTTSLFGKPSVFEVLKFLGGITITPLHQNVYPLQIVQISFNFTLINSVYQIQENFKALDDQLKSGLHLKDQEALYISLTNCRGSTVAPPTTVQTSVVLKIGVSPSMPRMKQLAKTIKDSPAKNLGLNNTIFGKVKQVSLTSILPAGGASSPTPAPAPGPVSHFHHHHSHHHHHHHHHGTSYPPATAPSRPPTRASQRVEGSPAPARTYVTFPRLAPAPVKGYHASPPWDRSRFKGRHPGKSPEHSPTSVTVAPSMSHHYTRAPSPRQQAKQSSPVGHQISPSSLPNVIYARAPPPLSGSETAPEPPDKTPKESPLTSSGGHNMAVHWILSLLVALLLGSW